MPKDTQPSGDILTGTGESPSQVPEQERVRVPFTCDDVPTPSRMAEITWRIFRIMSEFVDGFQFLSSSCKEVTFFGSARLKPSSPWYKETVKLAEILGKNGFTVITGGGPGIMEAANKGADKAGAPSLGLNIQLPSEQRINPYVHKGKGFNYFFTRKVMLAASAQAYIFCPGGFGTMDEFFEIITLIQTKKMQNIPVVCLGKEFWKDLDKFISKTLVDEYKTISPKDRNIYHIVDTAEEAYELIKDSKERTIF